ncbi:MAG: DUF86 domain-containing protein [Proteobacteria bacterium]|nr:DUF86 domain-containing protein [Pseudomonadota bacterium]
MKRRESDSGGLPMANKPDQEKANRLIGFINESTVYFTAKLEKVDKDRYFADRDIRNILDKTINDIILCMVDLAEECLKKHKKTIPDTYKDTVLACHEYFGEVALRVAPLVKRRNETIHQYLKVNWQNILAIKNRIDDLREFAKKADEVLFKNRKNHV